MYKIIGADGNEYGPVTAEQLRQWIAEGRVNPQTKVQIEGSAEWNTLAELPGFSDTDDSPAASAPLLATGPVDAKALVAGILARGYEIDIGSCIQRSWDLWKSNLGIMVAATLIATLLVGGVGTGLSLIIRLLFGFRSIGGMFIGLGANFLWAFVVGGPMFGGLYWFLLKLVRGEPATVSDVFAGFTRAFGPLVATYLLMTVLMILGCVLCLIPGIYLSVAWIFALPLVIDRNFGAWEALEVSRKVVTRHWWILFVLVLLAGLIGTAGVVACCIGVLVTAPLTHTILIYAYQDVFGTPPS